MSRTVKERAMRTWAIVRGGLGATLALSAFLAQTAPIVGEGAGGRFDPSADIERRQAGYLVQRPGIWLALIKGKSMAPLIPEGSYVLVVPVNWDDIAAGDIVVWNQSRCPNFASDMTPLVVHEVWGKGSGVLMTKGYANTEPDWCLVHPDMIVGRVLAVMR